MASVESEKQSEARTQLDFALGKKVVHLDQLTGREFDDLLKSILNDVDLRELRGFKELSRVISIRPGFFLRGAGRNNTLVLEFPAENPDFEAAGIPVSLDSHALEIHLGMGMEFGSAVFKRHETGEETSDWQVANSWGKSCYHYKGSRNILVIFRPRNHSRADENLATVSFSYEKVQLENRFVITKVRVDHLPVKGFRESFGPKYAFMAWRLIEELESAYSSTVNDLECQANVIRSKMEKMKVLSSRVFYSSDG